jgi:hypothetical protein
VLNSVYGFRTPDSQVGVFSLNQLLLVELFAGCSEQPCIASLVRHPIRLRQLQQYSTARRRHVLHVRVTHPCVMTNQCSFWDVHTARTSSANVRSVSLFEPSLSQWENRIGGSRRQPQFMDVAAGAQHGRRHTPARSCRRSRHRPRPSSQPNPARMKQVRNQQDEDQVQHIVRHTVCTCDVNDR